MHNGERYHEDNIARLIQPALAPEARPDPLTREQTWRRLETLLHAKRTPTAFPDWALVVLAGILALMAAWLANQIFAGDVSMAMSPSFIVIALLLAFNLVCMPIAAVVIVIRRRYV